MKNPFLILVSFLFVASCSDSEGPNVTPAKNKLNISFYHDCDYAGHLRTDTLMYTNALGQQYMVTDLQYFVSQVALHRCNGIWEKVIQDNGIHYVDEKIPSTLNWQTNLETGCFDSVRFVFGLNEAENISGKFPDPPMRDMFWPEVLGGGYHYMKMNLKWKNENMPQLMPFMFHLGVGQVYSGTTASTDSIIGFVQNHFDVSLYCSVAPKDNSLVIGMRIDDWFTGQNDFDFSGYPMGIMQNQEGMHRAIENGKKAFSTISYIHIPE